MATTVKVSPRFSLALPDYVKGAGIAAGTALLQMIVDTLRTENLVFDWRTILVTSISAGIAYLIKNGIIEPPQTTVVTKTNADLIEVAKDVKQVV